MGGGLEHVFWFSTGSHGAQATGEQHGTRLRAHPLVGMHSHHHPASIRMPLSLRYAVGRGQHMGGVLRNREH